MHAMPRGLRLAALLGGLALAAGCVSRPLLSPQNLPLTSWPVRRAQLQRIASFALNGRLAATNGKQGFSAGMHWEQRGPDANVQISGPLGFGGARIQQMGTQLRITTSDGRTLEGDAAQAQLANMLGFDPPLQSLRFWVLGVADPNSPGAQRSLDAQQRLASLQQDGWQIQYDEYTAVQRQWLPRRLTVTHDHLRLKLIINAWQL
jgi:outer membrane lipoprotein LolB